MLTQDKDGIVCDLCGAVLQKQFSYFSVRSTKVAVDCTKNESRVEIDETNVMDFEICPDCYKNKFTDQILSIRNK